MLFLDEKFIPKKFIGMILGTAGILVIILEPIIAGGVGGSIIGNIFLVIATVAAVGQTIAGKKIINKYDPWAFTVWAFIIGAASFLPLAAYEFIKQPHLYAALDWRGYMGVAWGAIFSSAAGYGLFAWGLSKISATDASIFSYVDPIAGTILGFFLLHEPITPLFITGAIFIFAGIFIAEGRIHYHPIKKLMLLGTPITEAAIPVIPPPPVTNHKRINKKQVLSAIFEKK